MGSMKQRIVENFSKCWQGPLSPETDLGEGSIRVSKYF